MLRAALSVALISLALILEPAPVLPSLSTLGVAIGSGALWWGLSIALLMWATVRLELARVGILLMSEVIVGAGTAAFFAAEHLSTVELVGGALVLLGGVLEVWPTRQKA